MRQTTHCVACRNQISVGEPTCWACGAVQAPQAPAHSAQTLDAYHRPCPRCQHPVAVYHRECRNCGYALGRSTNTLPAELPSGWEAAPQPDGSVLLKRSTWNRISFSGQSPGFLFVVMTWLILELMDGLTFRRTMPATGPVARIATPIIALVLVVLVTIFLVWLLFGTERWRVAQNLIQIDKECLGRHWGPSYTQAELLLRTPWRTTSRYRRYQVCQLLVREYGKDYVLSEASLSGAIQLQALGSYLSAHTGWPLQLPLEWPPSPSLWGSL